MRVESLNTDIKVCRDLRTNEDLFLWIHFNNGIYIVSEMNGKRTFKQNEVFTINGRNFCLKASQIVETSSGVMKADEENQ